MMRAMFVSILTVLLLSLPVSMAHAQDAEQDVKTYDFSGDNIDGDLLRPDGDAVDARNFASHSSLIRIRQDFVKEILMSAEDL